MHSMRTTTTFDCAPQLLVFDVAAFHAGTQLTPDVCQFYALVQECDVYVHLHTVVIFINIY